MIKNIFEGKPKEAVLDALDERGWGDAVEQINLADHLFRTEPDELLHELTDETIQTLGVILLETGKLAENEKIHIHMCKPGNAVCAWHQNHQSKVVAYIQASGEVEAVLWGKGFNIHEAKSPSLQGAIENIRKVRNLA